MKIFIEAIEGSFYVDILINQHELERIKKNEMVNGEAVAKGKFYYFGVKLQSNWDAYEEEDEGDEEN